MNAVTVPDLNLYLQVPQLHSRDPIYDDNDLDALASLLVSSPSWEVIAVGLQQTKEKVPRL
jgi:hypothetical protein